ncbi:MAG: maleylpyruvate isomerase family mycothiol-dependent enzyme [Actinomycetota bacterium]|nr:maleylpyruvate isomerase family mycothiol-dependent enzyme [Actinomycetota bacterium]
MNTTVTPVREIRPLDHDEAMAMAEVEYQRFLAAVEGLAPSDWSAATDCPGWDVRAVVAHVLGMCELDSSRAEAERQISTAAKIAADTGGYRIDALTALQVREHAHLTPPQLLEALRQAAPGALAGRTHTPETVRASSFIPGAPPYEEWTLGYLLDVIHTRDVWMHRVDIARATGTDLVLTGDHDGRFVALVVAEWAARHGKAFTLHLDGPAGGSFGADGGEVYHLDAVEFCRIVSGREKGTGLLAQEVRF